MASGIFITGTDTGVGKSWVTAGLVAMLRQRDATIGVWKPVQSGCRYGDIDADSYRLKYESGVPDSEPEIAPFSFMPALTPRLAARLDGTHLSLRDVIDGGRTVRERYRSLIVEGAGGLAVPLTEDGTVADLVVALQMPLIIVARPALGTINHTVLTVDYARRCGIRVLGVIINGWRVCPAPVEDSLDSLMHHPHNTEPEWSNPTLIAEYGDVPILGAIPWVPDTVDLQQRVDLLTSHLKMRPIYAAVGVGHHSD